MQKDLDAEGLRWLHNGRVARRPRVRRDQALCNGTAEARRRNGQNCNKWKQETRGNLLWQKLVSIARGNSFSTGVNESHILHLAGEPRDPASLGGVQLPLPFSQLASPSMARQAKEAEAVAGRLLQPLPSQRLSCLSVSLSGLLTRRSLLTLRLLAEPCSACHNRPPPRATDLRVGCL